jgi:hypothetical protein
VRLDRAQAYVPPGGPEFWSGRAGDLRAGHRARLGLLSRTDHAARARRAGNSRRHLARRPISHPKRVKKWSAVGARAIEVARYVLAGGGVHHHGAHAFRDRSAPPVAHAGRRQTRPSRLAKVIGEMVARVRELDPQFFDRFNNGYPRRFSRNGSSRARMARRSRANSMRGWAGALRSWWIIRRAPCRSDGRRVSRRRGTYRRVPGQRSDRPLLNPARNPVSPRDAEHRRARADDARAAARQFHLRQENQPHRGQPGPAPSHGPRLAPAAHPGRYARPRLHGPHADCRENPARAKCTNAPWPMLGPPRTSCSIAASRAEFALYLLPNAKCDSPLESGSLLHLLHKWTMRTCFNAQEEIYQASMEEVAQVRSIFPVLGRYIGPPCLSARVGTPICTEGSHFCGVKVWVDFPNVCNPNMNSL